jgi:hypothetical protein
MERFTAAKTEGVGSMVDRYEASRISPGEEFSQLYSDYDADMERARNFGEVCDGKSEEAIGKKAEALIFSGMKNNEINQHFRLCPTSKYDDYFHGADLLLEPRNSNIQSLAAIDVTTNQEDIKGRARSGTEAGEVRPVGFETKIKRARAYSERLASINPNYARELSGWLESGGLHEKRTQSNDVHFKDAERLFLMKYYVGSEDAAEPNKPGYVIGGPQAVITIDNSFINKAMQGDKESLRAIGDLSVLEFTYCVQAELQHLDKLVREEGSRNIFFDKHYSKVRAWVNVLNRPEITQLLELMVGRNARNTDFRNQLSYYMTTFTKLNQGR